MGADDAASSKLGSGASGGTMSVVSKQTGKTRKTAEEVSDRKKIKVLKQALKDERAQKGSLQEELNVLKERNRELSKEHETMSNKYLSLYDENDKLQELLNTMQYKIQQASREGGGLESDLAELANKFDFLKKGASSGAEQQRAQREMQAQHENELQAMQVTLKKIEKELGYKDEECRHYKKMASEVAEKYEKCDRQIKHLQDTIADRDKDNDRLEARICEFEVRIGKLNTEKLEFAQEFERKDSEKTELEKKIEDLNITI